MIDLFAAFLLLVAVLFLAAGLSLLDQYREDGPTVGTVVLFLAAIVSAGAAIWLGGWW